MSHTESLTLLPSAQHLLGVSDVSKGSTPSANSPPPLAGAPGLSLDSLEYAYIAFVTCASVDIPELALI